MLSLLMATGTLEKVAWIVGALVVMILCGGMAARFASAHTSGIDRVNLPKEFDRGFRKPPDEGGLL
jgi:hypothetical protein